MAIDPTIESRFGELLSALFRELAGDFPASLYHYTSVASLRSIVTSGVMRAYNLGQMNDWVEARYAASIMRAHIDRSFAVEENPNASELLGALREVGVDFSDTFALSFTSDGDELGMWRLYADRTRGFSFAVPLHNALSWLGDGHHGLIMKCSYDHQVLSHFCARALDRMRQIYLDDILAGKHVEPATYANVFLQNATWLAPAFKPAVWQDEKEWRFIFRRPSVQHHKLTSGRTYIELPLLATPQSTPPIAAMCAGPDCDYADSISPMQQLLFEKGYGNFAIHLSTKYQTRPGRMPPPPGPSKTQ